MPFGQPTHAQEELPSAQFTHPDSRLRLPHLIPGLGTGAADGECHPFVELAPGGGSAAGITSTPAAPTAARWSSRTRDQAAAEHIKLSIPVDEDAHPDSRLGRVRGLSSIKTRELVQDCLIPVEEDDMVSEVLGQIVVSQLTTGISSLLLEGTANEDVDAAAPARMPLLNLIKTLGTISFLTMVFVISTALYQPAAGVLFGRIKVVYYVTLGAIFLLGLSEAITAVLLSRGSHDDIRRRFKLCKVVLCASVVPFVAIIGIGGSRFIKG